MNLLNEETLKLSVERSKICAECSWCKKGEDIDNPIVLQALFPQDYYCDQNESTIIDEKEVKGCSCPVHKKGLSPKSKCPQNKWNNG